MKQKIQKWMKQKSNVSRKLDELKMKLEQRQSDQQEILLERIRDKAHEEIYTKMLKNCEAQYSNNLLLMQR